MKRLKKPYALVAAIVFGVLQLILPLVIFTHTAQAAADYYWVDEGHIETTNGNKLYNKETNGQFVWRADPGTCKEYITPGNNDPAKGTLHHNAGARNRPTEGSITCPADAYEKRAIGIDKPENRTIKSGEGRLLSGQTTKEIDARNAPGDEPSCEKNGGDLSWILCPALRLSSSFLRFVDEKVNNLLTIPNSYYNSPQVEASWSRMRDLAYIILIPVMLVMIISTALGFEFVSAYTFKKAMPRLFIAVLFMSLSLEITQFLVVLTNDVGQGILGLVTSSFSGADEITLASLFNPGGGAGALFTGGVIVGAIAAPGLIAVLLLYLVTAGLALLVALLALSLRQMLLIAFMVIAPLAILAWIFPGNDKLWKLWWGSFSKLLLLFPLIMFLIASGRAFATLVQEVGSDDFLATILKLTAYVGPYFFIPAMFKFAGGIFATVTGMANDRERGLFDRLKKSRQKGFGKAWERAKAGQYYGKNANPHSLQSRLGEKMQTASLFASGKAGFRPSMMDANMQNAREVAELEHSNHLLRENAFIRKHHGDDDFAMGVIEGEGDYNKTRDKIDESGKGRFERDPSDPTGKRLTAKGAKDLHNLTSAALAYRKIAGPAASLTALRGGLAPSSTAWKEEYEMEDDGHGGQTYKLDADNNRIVKGVPANIKMLRSINKALGHSRGLLPNVTSEVRTGQDQAGRPELGSPSFADTMHASNLVQQLGNNATPQQLDVISKSLYKSAMEGKPLGGMIGGKDQPAQALTRIAVQSTRDLLTDNMTGKWGRQGPRYGAGSDDHKKAIVVELSRLAGSLQAAANFSDSGREANSRALGTKIDLKQLHPEIQDLLTTTGYETVDTGIIDPKTNKTITRSGARIDKPASGKITIGQAIKNLERSNPEMANTIKVYVEQETAARAAQMAQMAAQQAASQAAAAQQANNPNAIPPITPPPPAPPSTF